MAPPPFWNANFRGAATPSARRIVPLAVAGLAVGMGLSPGAARAAEFTAHDDASLRQAIIDANADSDAKTTITLTDDIAVAPSTLPQITRAMEIVTGTHQLQGSAGSGISFDIAPGIALTIDDGTATGGNGAAGTYSYYYDGGDGGDGGNAITFSGDSVTNDAETIGGNGGIGGYSYYGDGGDGGDGGAGVRQAVGGALINGGAATGGAGGAGGAAGYFSYGKPGEGGHGGAGIYFTGDTLTSNAATTGGEGGAGGAAYRYGGDGGRGGDGIWFVGTGATNNAVANGGDGGDGGGSYDGGVGGEGGDGIWFSGDQLTNKAAVAGGNGGTGSFGVRVSGSGGEGGDGIDFNDGGTLINHAAAIGGHGGDAGSNDTIYSVYGGVGGDGGAGIEFIGDTLVNDSSVTAGDGGAGSYGVYPGGYGGFGGLGVDVKDGGTVTNSGDISGGNGGAGGDGVKLEDYASYGGYGGYGVYLRNGGTVINSGDIHGGAGGTGGDSRSYYDGPGGGSGGGGVWLEGGELINKAGGVVVGGHGGTGGTGLASGATGGHGGRGGYGVDAEGGVTVTNFGDISGGNGGAGGAGYDADGAAGSGGIGITGSDLVIINNGTISGGFAADSTTRADAIQFRDGTNRLELRSGSTINGTVSATIGTDDTLALGGDDNAAFDLSQLGDAAQYQGFESLEKTGASTWTLTGSSAWAGPTHVTAGTLLVNGTLGSAASTLDVGSGATLGGSGTLGGDVTVAGTLAAGNSPGTITIGGDLVLNSGSTTVFELDTPGVAGGSGNDLIEVGSDLTLGGTLDARVAAAGYYRLFEYDGGLLDNSFDAQSITSTTPGFTIASSDVQTAIAGQVNLSVLGAGQTMQFWDGADTTGNGSVDGGKGTWSSTGTNWTGEPGHAGVNGSWGGSVGVFAGAAGGTVTVDATQTFDTLQFSTDGYTLTGGTLAIDPASGTSATLNINDGVTATITSTIVDGGGTVLAKTGAGTLILTGINTYTGDTALDGGTLSVATDANLGDASGNLSFDGGTLENTAALSTARDVLLADGGGRFLTDADLTVDGVVSGPGALTKAGTGALILTGNSAGFTGQTHVDAGALRVNGTLGTAGSALDVGSGATLGGSGTLGGDVTVAGGATLAPGNSIGTLHVNGDIAFDPNAVYAVEVDAAGNTDLTDVTGTATLDGGSVKVLAADGDYAPQTDYVILSAEGGVTGQFDSLSSNLAFLNPALVYDPDTVVLTLTRNDIDFTQVAKTGNQRATAAGAESTGIGNPIYDGLAGLDAPSARAAFDALSGEVYASVQGALLSDSRYLRSAVSDRLRHGCADRPRPADAALDAQPRVCGGTLWTRAFGAWGHRNGDGNAARIDHNVRGFFIGRDTAVGQAWRLGFVGGYSHATSNVNARASDGDRDSFQLGVYAGTHWGALNFDTGAAYAWHDINSQRHVRFHGFTDNERANYAAHTAQVFTELGYDVDFGRSALTPFARAAYVHLDTENFDERGGAAALHNSGKTNALGVSTLGVRLSSVLTTTDDATIRAHSLVGWRHAYGDVTPGAELALEGGTRYTVSGAPLARDALALEVGLDADLSPHFSLGASYVGQFGNGVEINGVKGSMSWRF